MDNNQNNFDPITGQPIQNVQYEANNQQQMPQQVNTQYQQVPNYDMNQKKKVNPIKIILMVLGGMVLFFIVLWCVIFFGGSATSNKLVCKSNEGNITIMYKNNQLVGYSARGMTYDMDTQKQIANQIGVEEYLNQFDTWFRTNTTGSCERK